MAYFLIHNSDGDTTVKQVDVNELLLDLGNGEYGNNIKFLDALPKQSDTNYWGDNAYLIIKGEVVSPKSVQVTTVYTID